MNNLIKKNKNELVTSEIINFTELVKNSNTTLSFNLQTKMIDKLNKTFDEKEQHWYVANLYMYMNYHPTNDFPINLEHVFKMIGFANKGNAMKTIKSNFVLDEDYRILLFRTEKQVHGGHNKDQVMLNVDTFKNLCMIAKTDKGKEIRKYYVKLETIYNELMKEELDEQKLILQNKDDELQKKDELLIQQREQTREEKEQLLENTLLNQYCKNIQCIYYGKIDNTDTVGGTLVKFGMSNNLQERVKTHKKTYTNFRLTNVFKVTNQIEIENCIKKHPILKKRIRNIIINDINYRELICIDSKKNDPLFSLEILDNYIQQIIEENQYNIENYNRLLERNNDLEIEIVQLQNQNQNQILKQEKEKLQKRVDQFKPSIDENKFKTHNKIETSCGYSLFAFKCNNLRYKIGLCKTATLESREKVYKANNDNCEIQGHVKIKHPFLEKTLLYLLKRHLTFLNNDTFDGSLNDIRLIFNIISKLEDILINNDLENIVKIINNEKIELQYNDPEVPFIKKAKRSIDQIDKDSGIVLATYPSIESAGRALELTTGTAIGVALRNKSVCKGFLWRYSGISKEDQMADQKVIRIKCDTGEKTHYPNIASAARDAKISPPGLRNRILTDVHCNGYHWNFDKTATHYFSKK
jgi:phage anti-repressor protein